MATATRVRRLTHAGFIIMAASAAMIVAGAGFSVAHAQDVGPVAPQSQPQPRPSGITRVNQIQDLHAQVRQLRGEIEVLRHQLQQLRQSGKDRYVDLDSRITRLEQVLSPAAGSTAAPAQTSTVTAVAAATPMSAADKAAASKAYQAAFKQVRDGDYVGSARAFRAFIDSYPQSTLVSNAYYWLGGSYYVTQAYQPALAAYRTLLQKYPGSDKAAEARLRVGECQIGLKDFAAARATLEAFIKQAEPHSKLAQRAQQRLQQLPVSSGTR